MLTSTLDWTEHINYISLRANRKLNVLRSVGHLGRKTLDILYKLTVRSCLDYGLHIIYNSLSQQLKKRLSQIQYRAAKLVSGWLHYTNQARLEAELGWESIQIRAEILGLSVFHKIHFNLTRPLIQKCISERNDNLYNLRNNGNLRNRHPYLSANYTK